MNMLLKWTVEGVILTAGIFVFLRVVRTARGSRIVRGLVVSLVGGTLALWAMSQALDLEELGYLIELVAGFVVVIFAVLFQPELRRAIAQLGEGGLLNRWMTQLGPDSIQELCLAVNVFSAKRTGALIAIERENPLDAYIEGGVHLGAEVGRDLVESIFQPKSALHDGAIILRKDRIEAACCLLPLTENLSVARSLGTRHRAAMGLTEECDAVVVVVSEETGSVSICKRGDMQSVSAGKLEEALRTAITPEQVASAAGAPAPSNSALRRFIRRDLVWLGAAMILAATLLLFANQRVRTEGFFSLEVVAHSAAQPKEPEEGQLVVLVPTDDVELVGWTPKPLRVVVGTSRAQLADIGAEIRGQLELEESPSGSLSVPIDRVRWLEDERGMSFRWEEEGSALLEFVTRSQVDLTPGPDALNIHDEELDKRYEVSLENALFDPSVVTVSGPAESVASLRDGNVSLKFNRIVLGKDDTRDRHTQLHLSDELLALDLELLGSPNLTLPVVPSQREVSVLEREVVLTCLDPLRMDELQLWSLPQGRERVRFRILCTGLIRAEPGTDFFDEIKQNVVRFVDENLVALVDMSEIPADGSSREATIHALWRTGWRESPEIFLLEEGSPPGPYERLDVELVDADERILLDRRE